MPVYPSTAVDSTGVTLSGANRYTITLAKGETAPVKGFWSITMSMTDQGWWFVPNQYPRDEAWRSGARMKPLHRVGGSLSDLRK